MPLPSIPPMIYLARSVLRDRTPGHRHELVVRTDEGGAEAAHIRLQPVRRVALGVYRAHGAEYMDWAARYVPLDVPLPPDRRETPLDPDLPVLGSDSELSHSARRALHLAESHLVGLDDEPPAVERRITERRALARRAPEATAPRTAPDDTDQADRRTSDEDRRRRRRRRARPATDGAADDTSAPTASTPLSEPSAAPVDGGEPTGSSAPRRRRRRGGRGRGPRPT